jgi:hypothetical protein
MALVVELLTLEGDLPALHPKVALQAGVLTDCGPQIKCRHRVRELSCLHRVPHESYRGSQQPVRVANVMGPLALTHERQVLFGKTQQTVDLRPGKDRNRPGRISSIPHDLGDSGQLAVHFILPRREDVDVLDAVAREARSFARGPNLFVPAHTHVQLMAARA